MVCYVGGCIAKHGAKPTSQEWAGLYETVQDTMLEWVVCAGFLKAFRFGPVEPGAELMGSFPSSIVGLQYFTLTEAQPNAKKVVPLTVFLKLDVHS